ncbi:uncharacterized protein B0I36DRAFT_138129 [Microdochium trichocladiopsis]|uniref:Uncharacterized protein n=1 Tax=Microdochium trichocladiopsis TaxID=1682393 RepID=A0A9P8Y4G9_9PEZI|nr:uncharacterized protein B0I36DRAFT_138129 [Microdochium trichocladiopsis]KAH7027396.1 hypothetical protein B0I36DRAFT_138129 [Microdochium trichocladiopsis]
MFVVCRLIAPSIRSQKSTGAGAGAVAVRVSSGKDPFCRRRPVIRIKHKYGRRGAREPSVRYVRRYEEVEAGQNAPGVIEDCWRWMERRARFQLFSGAASRPTFARRLAVATPPFPDAVDRVGPMFLCLCSTMMLFTEPAASPNSFLPQF